MKVNRLCMLFLLSCLVTSSGLEAKKRKHRSSSSSESEMSCKKKKCFKELEVKDTLKANEGQFQSVSAENGNINTVTANTIEASCANIDTVKSEVVNTGSVFAENIGAEEIGAKNICTTTLKVDEDIQTGACVLAEGLVLGENGENPCGKENTLWVKEGEPSKLSFTDNNGTDFCVDVSPKEPIVGKWMSQFSGGPYGSGRTLLWEFFVDDSGQLSLRWLAGTQNQIREWTPDDVFSWFGPVFQNNASVTKVSPNAYTYFGPNMPIEPSEAYFGNDPQLTIWNQRVSLRIQDNDPDLMLMVAPDYTPLIPSFYIQGTQLLRRVKDEALPRILVQDPPNADTTNPQFIFNTFFDIWQTQLTQLETVINPSDYPGFAQIQAKRDFMLQNPVVRQTPIVDVWRTRTPIAYDTTFSPAQVPASTSLLMQEFVAFRGMRIYIEGFEGDYAILNSVNSSNLDYLGVPFWKTSVIEGLQGRDIANVYTPQHYNSTNQRNIINIDVDSSTLPPYNPAVHGVATLRAEAGPVRADTEYYDLQGAVKELLTSFGVMTHASAFSFGKNDMPLQLLDTFAELIAAFDNLTLNFNSLASRARWPAHTTNLYLNPSLQNFSSSGTVPANEPLGINQNDPQWFNPDTSSFSIVRQNYLDPDKTFTMFWAVDPNSPSDPLNITGQLTSFGYKNNGSRFLFSFENYSAPNPDPLLFDFEGGYKDHTVYGIIKPELINGEIIAYIYYDDLLFFDDYVTSTILGAGTLPEMLEPGQIAGYQNQLNMLGVAMKKLMEYNPSKFILDIRGNSGGNGWQSLASFFGTDRAGVTRIFSFADNSFRGILSAEELATNFQSVFDTLQANLPFEQILASETAQQFPDAVFKNGKVVALTDIHSASAGDVSPHYLTDPDAMNTRMLGNGVESRIVGDIDGRLVGEGGFDINLPINENQNTRLFGGPVESMFATTESVNTFRRNGSNGYFLANQQPITEPDVLLDGDISKTAWPDLGYTSPHTLAPLPGWTASGNVQESTDVQAVADNNKDLAGKYFFISSTTTDYAVWFKVSGTGVAPVVPRTLVQVDLDTNDSAAVVATKTAAALELTGDFTILFPAGDTARVTNRVGGSVTDVATPETSGFTINVVTPGANNVVGQPNPLDHDTWRDTWLEFAIAC